MFTFDIQDMTCGHCVATINRTLKALDPQAEVAIDLASHRVEVQTQRADADQIVHALREAGFTPQVTQAG